MILRCNTSALTWWALNPVKTILLRDSKGEEMKQKRRSSREYGDRAWSYWATNQGTPGAAAAGRSKERFYCIAFRQSTSIWYFWFMELWKNTFLFFYFVVVFYSSPRKKIHYLYCFSSDELWNKKARVCENCYMLTLYLNFFLSAHILIRIPYFWDSIAPTHSHARSKQNPKTMEENRDWEAPKIWSVHSTASPLKPLDMYQFKVATYWRQLVLC